MWPAVPFGPLSRFGWPYSFAHVFPPVRPAREFWVSVLVERPSAQTGRNGRTRAQERPGGTEREKHASRGKDEHARDTSSCICSPCSDWLHAATLGEPLQEGPTLRFSVSMSASHNTFCFTVFRSRASAIRVQFPSLSIYFTPKYTERNITKIYVYMAAVYQRRQEQRHFITKTFLGRTNLLELYSASYLALWMAMALFDVSWGGILSQWTRGVLRAHRPLGSVCSDHVGVHRMTVEAHDCGKCSSNMRRYQ